MIDEYGPYCSLVDGWRCGPLLYRCIYICKHANALNNANATNYTYLNTKKIPI